LLLARHLTNLIVISGQDQKSYLQGQVTCDVQKAQASSLTHGAHCDAKGKVYSVFRLITRDDSQWLIQTKSAIAQSLAALQKFGVFAKVEIKQAGDISCFALIGEDATVRLKQMYHAVPDNMSPVLQVGSITIAYLAGKIDRYLLIVEQHELETELAKFNLPVYQHDVWNLLEITEGFPLLTNNSILEFVPQMLNVQAIHGISFTKGCYLGQETVARMQYLGKNKRALYGLAGQTAPVSLDDQLELQLGEHWKRAGIVQASYHADNGQTYLQAVLPSDIDLQSQLRVKQQPETQLHILPLPYSLEP
jgi:tRNA-modifying protein YgfZ